MLKIYIQIIIHEALVPYLQLSNNNCHHSYLFTFLFLTVQVLTVKHKRNIICSHSLFQSHILKYDLIDYCKVMHL